MSSEFAIEIATRAQKPMLENLFQLYVHDFTEQWQGTARGELNEDGRFDPYPHMESYWAEEGRVPMLLRTGGRIAGFALVNRFAHSGEKVDRSMAEFFVARKHRRSGLGAWAAGEIFSRYPGVWEAAVARKNVGALAFWRRVIAEHPFVSTVEPLDRSDAHWNGVIFRFTVKA